MIIRLFFFVVFLLLLSDFGEAEFTPFTEGCGGTYRNEAEGVISSPGYPNNNYPPDTNCTYIVIAPTNHVVVYQSTFMELESEDVVSNLCVYDRLTLLDEQNKAIISYCGTKPIYPEVSESNTLKIEFITDFDLQYKGFSLRWRIFNLDDRPVELKCNFDEPIALCAGWLNENEDYPWLFNRQTTVSPNTGPLRDHTTDSDIGRYAHTEGSGASFGDTAILTSPAIVHDSSTNRRCVRFWYHMFGSGMGNLSVVVKSNSGETVLTKYTGDQGEDWLKGEYTFTMPGLLATVSFVGQRGRNYMSDIAIDDLDISLGSCDGDEEPAVGRRFPGIGGLPAVGIVPTDCPSNLVKDDCQTICDLTCENIANGENNCQRACLGTCACPADQPIYEQGQCVDIPNCTLDFTTAPYEITSVAETDDTKTTVDTTTTESTSSVKHRKKEKVAKDLVNDFMAALYALVRFNEG